MARVVVIHNQDDKASRDLLSALKTAYDDAVEPLNFMAHRDNLWFRGCPVVRLFPVGSTSYDADDAAWSSEVTVTKDDVAATLPLCRVIALSVDNATIHVEGGADPALATITTTLTDLDGNDAAMDGVTFDVAGITTDSDDGSLEFSSASAGTFTIRCRHAYAAEASIQVTVEADA